MYYKNINTGSRTIKWKKLVPLMAGCYLFCLVPLAGQNLDLFPMVSWSVDHDTMNVQADAKVHTPAASLFAGEISSPGSRIVKKEPAGIPSHHIYRAALISLFEGYVTFVMIFTLKGPSHLVTPVLIMETGKRLVLRRNIFFFKQSRLTLADN
ncbi:MAG: hypothetical protein ACP5D1_10160 [Bacteroidales bacterium]